jgi:Universal stress protein family
MRKAAKREKTGVFRRILVPTDLSDRNARSLKLALALARDGPTSVTLVHVVQQVPGLPPGEMRAFYDRLVKRSRRGLTRAASTTVSRISVGLHDRKPGRVDLAPTPRRGVDTSSRWSRGRAVQDALGAPRGVKPLGRGAGRRKASGSGGK